MKLKLIIIMVALILIVSLGSIFLCNNILVESPDLMKNWPRIKSGMEQSEVRRLLGEPDIKHDWSKPESSGNWAADVAAYGIAGALFGPDNASWEYYPADISESIKDNPEMFIDAIFGPSDNNFVIYFDSKGLVSSLRNPSGK